MNFYPIGLIPLNGYLQAGSPLSSAVSSSVSLVTSSCNWYQQPDISTTWANQADPATTWTVAPGC